MVHSFRFFHLLFTIHYSLFTIYQLEADKGSLRHLFKGCSPNSIRPQFQFRAQSSEFRVTISGSTPNSKPENRNFLYNATDSITPNPVVGVKLTACEFRDHFKDLIRESADVQDVVTLLRLHRAVRLNVNADHS